MDQHLISVDELRAAGALDVPATWRKSLASETRYTLPGFGDEDETADSDEVARLDQLHETAPAPQRRQNRTHHRRAELSTENGEE